MPKIKMSIPRLLRLVAMLKENKYPNHPRLLKEMQELGLEDTFDISQKTLQRDVKFLIHEYKAPIAYDYRRRGYFLLDSTWQVDLPLKKSDLYAASLGARVAQSMMPMGSASTLGMSAESKSFIEPANAEEHPAYAFLASLNTEGTVPVDVFQAVYDAWYHRQELMVKYLRAQDGLLVELHVQPHTLAFYNGRWYVKVQRLNSEPQPCAENGIISLALQRIQGIEVLPAHFTPNPEILKEAASGKLFNLPTVNNVLIRLTGKSVFYGLEAFANSTYTRNPDGSVILVVPEAEEFRIVNFAMTWPGEVVVEEPQNLVRKICDNAMSILMAHQEKIKLRSGLPPQVSSKILQG
ncbi:MAG: WYL domain-containing protein [Victivallales bacterium]|nr:WYL domain-containing protein [Victivallales bacterium]